MTYFFDMDGTIADLYSVDKWLEKLRSSDPAPYREAAPLLRFSTFARLLHKVQAAGHSIGIISWTSKVSTPAYDLAVAQAKTEWLKRHLPSVQFDEIHIVPYGTAKAQFAKENDILFDDDERVRASWHGEAFTPDMIFEILRKVPN